MAKFNASGVGQTSNNTLLAGAVYGGNASPRRIKVYDIVVALAVAPNDNTLNASFKRVSGSAGTSTSVTPNPLVEGDPTISNGGRTYTANPSSIGVELLFIPLNQRSTARWFAAPSSELEVPAGTQFKGIGLQPISPSPTATDVGFTILFIEE